ncbi:MAG: sigma 54-interacting transcriptional regulator [Clostridiales bacterium]|nr:sigma 54-interacting transcriptional regulator [Clostridiales bacterium]
MNIDNLKNYEFILEHIPGAMVIDLEGMLVYLNGQCAEYIEVDRDWAMGKHITEVFPETKMIDSLDIDKPTIVFYHCFGVGISVHIPVFQDGRRVGLLEYDVVQSSEVLYELADDYTDFLNEQLHDLRRKINELRGAKYCIDDIIGKSAAIDKLKEDIVNAARCDATVLIYGETGTGKELVAHSIHNMSRRAKNNFMKINSANLPENLVESELFGYEKGTFTGAEKEGKIGKFELADKGTLFIDEINQMSMSVQPKLLRVLQENEIEKLGGDKSISIDTRVIATTNQDIVELVNKGKFREDLYYRLYVVPVYVPPLRNRKEDIPLLTDHFVKICSRNAGKSITEIMPQVYGKLADYEWPGNVRELQNVIERGIAFSRDNRLTAKDINIPGQRQNILTAQANNPIEEAKNNAERELILQALEESKGNKSKAAEILKISRPRLYQKIKRLKIQNIRTN